MKKLLSIILVISAIMMTACATKTYERGVYTENGFDSEFIGFRYTTPEGYYMADEEQLAELMGLSLEVLGDSITEQQKAYTELSTVFEMMVSDPTGACNMNITVENNDAPMGKYIEAFKAQIQNVPGMEVTLNEGMEEATIAGTVYQKLTASVVAYGVAMNQEYYVAQIGDRKVGIALTYFEGMEAGRDALLDGFAAY